MDENINNLFCFYREAGASPSVLLVEKEQFSVVSEKKNGWPQMVFEINFSENPALAVSRVLSEIVKQHLPGFALCDAALFGAKELDYLRREGIYPVKTWTLMDTAPGIPGIGQRSENIEIRKLNTPEELNAFAGLVNAELLQSTKFDPELAKELRTKGGSSFYGLFVTGKLVSVLLAFSETKVTGLYFIATNPAYRRQGLASCLIRHVIDACHPTTKKIVLQAVPGAVPLYTHLGFVPRGKLVIFWKR